MNSSSVKRTRHSRLPLKARLTACAAILLGFGYAIAAPPPANTEIGNQATASYRDNSGIAQNATSNRVVTFVQQVGAFVLETDNDRFAGPGQTQDMPHVLRNTGNGSDSFNITVDEAAGTPDFDKFAIFADANEDGLADDTNALCRSGSAPFCDTAGITVTVPGGGKFSFVVSYTVPATANLVDWPENTGTVTATVDPGSTVPYDPATVTQTRTDRLQLTDEAAFTMSKSTAAPAVAAPGASGAWPTVTNSGPASSSAACSTVWVDGLDSDASCIYTVYTLTYKNSGASAGALSIRDVLPSGLTYVTGSAVWSSAAGQALGEATGPADDPAGITYEADQATGTILATIDPVNTTVSGSLSFVVLVNDTAAVGTADTTNEADYSTTSCSDPNTCTDSPTNGSPYTVLPTYGVVAANQASTTPDDVEDNPTPTGIDLVEEPQVVAGRSVYFQNYITNDGNDLDTFNITVSDSTFPANTGFELYESDGTTLLSDTNGDPIDDTGPLAAGATAIVVLKATIPAGTTVGDGPFDVLVTATSVNDTSGADSNDDSVWNSVLTVIASLVDLTNTPGGTGSGAAADGDLGPGPSPDPTTTETTPAGTGVTFPLYVANSDSLANTYTLAVSQTASFPGTMPPGWTVTFHSSGGVCGDPAITDVSVPASGQEDVVACVIPPTNAALAEQKVYFQVRSTSNTSDGSIVTDTKLDAVVVTVQEISAMTLKPDNNDTVTPNGAVDLAHSLANAGTQECGEFDVTADLPPADVAAGWNAALYLDTGTEPREYDNGDTLVTGPLPVLPDQNDSHELVVRVYAPSGAAINSFTTVTVTAVDNNTGGGDACPTVSAVDRVTVVPATVRLDKFQAADPTCAGTVAVTDKTSLSLEPGQCIVYEVVATNEGTDPVTDVSINDAIPAYTNFANATQPTPACESTGLTGTPVVFGSSGTPVVTVTCGSTGNELTPGGTLILRFSVEIDGL